MHIDSDDEKSLVSNGIKTKATFYGHGKTPFSPHSLAYVFPCIHFWPDVYFLDPTPSPPGPHLRPRLIVHPEKICKNVDIQYTEKISRLGKAFKY